MIKLQTDFHLSTIIEKRGRCPGGSKYTRRQMSGGRASVLGANVWGGGACDCNPFISLSVVVSLIFHLIYWKV